MTETAPIVYECRGCGQRFIDQDGMWADQHIVETLGHSYECDGVNCIECPVLLQDTCGPVAMLGHGGRLKRPYDLRPYRKLFLGEIRG